MRLSRAKSVFLATLLCAMAAISAAPAVAQDGDTVASEVLSAEAEAYPPLLAQRSISLPDLQLRLVPLTVDQLSALAAA